MGPYFARLPRALVSRIVQQGPSVVRGTCRSLRAAHDSEVTNIAARSDIEAEASQLGPELEDVILASPSLRTLRLRRPYPFVGALGYVCPSAPSVLQSAAARCTALIGLDLQSVRLRGMPHIASALRSMTGLLRLSLRDTGLGWDVNAAATRPALLTTAASVVSGAFTALTRLTSLDLGDNHLMDTGFDLCEPALRHLRHLRQLDLRNNYISANGPLAAVLGCCSQLHTLNLRSAPNALSLIIFPSSRRTRLDIVPLSPVLSSLPYLTDLDISASWFTEPDAEVLGAALGSMSQLRALVMTDCIAQHADGLALGVLPGLQSLAPRLRRFRWDRPDLLAHVYDGP